MKSYYYIYFVLFFITGLPGKASSLVVFPDTIIRNFRPSSIQAADTSITVEEIKLYEELKDAVSKKKWTKDLYNVLVNVPENIKLESKEESVEDEYQPYKDRKIRNIHIVILPPFGSDINHPDTTEASNWFNREANKLHTGTKKNIIRKNLLFKKGQTINPLNIAESEAFLRSASYINDVRIKIESIDGTNDVDVIVIVRDVWSIGLHANNISFKSFDIEFYNRNFLGEGSQVFIRSIYNNKYSPHFGYGLGYRHNNFLNSFVNLEGSIMNLITRTELLISADRPLHRALNYYGQIGFQQQKVKLHISPWDSVSPPHSKNFSVTLGRSFKLPGKPLSANRFVVAARYLENRFSYKMLNTVPDPLQYKYTSSRMILTQYSFYQQQYYRQFMIHNFGTAENIAHGYNISGQLGYNNCSDYFSGIYVSLSAAAGGKFNFGNLFVQTGISSYYHNHSFFHGFFNVRTRYFTPLVNIGVNRFRQFIEIDYSEFFKPVPGLANYLYFSSLSTMSTGQSNNYGRGTQRFMINTESDMFTALNIIGFRFMFFIFIDAAWINQSNNLLNIHSFYWGGGTGIRIRNELLVFNTIELKIGFYPQLHMNNISNNINLTTSILRESPDFTPKYPQEIQQQ